MPKYWENFTLGEKFATPGRTMGEGIISVISGLAGFTVPFFWDEEEAKKSIFGTRVAPARLTLLVMGGMEEQSGFYDYDTLIALLGLDKIRVKAPLKAGDTIRVHGEVIGKTETKNPDRGIIVHRSTCVNQKGEVIAESEATHLIQRRPK